MIKSPLPVLFAVALVACSGPAPDAPAPAAKVETPAAADSDALVRLGMVFTDADPWMAGALLVRGKLHVGDRLYLLTRDDPRVLVLISAIRDDDSQSDVTEAAAPQGVFLSFRPESPLPSPAPVGTDPLMVGDSSLTDHGRALGAMSNE